MQEMLEERCARSESAVQHWRDHRYDPMRRVVPRRFAGLHDLRG
jgi:hypothetical protein